MPRLLVEPMRDGSGTAFRTQVRITLVDGTGTPRIGWIRSSGEPTTECSNLVVDAPVEVPLVPNVGIAIDAEGSQTWYRVELATPHRREVYRVSMPDDDATHRIASF
jgi:hypothetical protein